MTPDFLDLPALAVQLHDARRSATPIDFIRETFPQLEWADARAIARLTDRLRLEDDESQIGWKLGWTSAAMRTALGIERPNWGTLWDTQVLTTAMPLDQFIHPKVEPELVWRAPDDLPPDATAGQVAQMGGAWALGIEVVDPRFPSFDFDALDNTADNSSSAAIRISDFRPIDTDPAAIDVAFSNGVVEHVGAGAQAMGSPFEAIAWLARSLAEEDLAVRAGDIVFTGGLTAPFDVRPGVTYTLSSPVFGDALSLEVS